MAARIQSNSTLSPTWSQLLSRPKELLYKEPLFFSSRFHDDPIGKCFIFVLIFSLTGFLTQEERKPFDKTEWPEEVDYVTYQFLMMNFISCIMSELCIHLHFRNLFRLDICQPRTCMIP